MNDKIALPGGYSFSIRRGADKPWDIYIEILNANGGVIFCERCEEDDDISDFKFFAAAMQPVQAAPVEKIVARLERMKAKSAELAKQYGDASKVYDDAIGDALDAVKQELAAPVKDEKGN